MKHKVPWNRTLLEDFMGMLEENAGGSPEEVQIIKNIERKLEKCKISKKLFTK